MDEMVVVAAEVSADFEATEQTGSRSRLGGAVVRVCEKCMQRQRDQGAEDAVAFLAEELRWRSQGDAGRTRMRVAEVGCMKVCPEDGVAVSASGPMGRVQGVVVRSGDEVAALHQRFRGEQSEAVKDGGELRGRALRRAQRLATAVADGQ